MCVAGHCYMIPEGGYQSRRSQDTLTHEGERRAGLRHSTAAHSALNSTKNLGRNREVGVAVRGEVKSRSFNQEGY